MIISDISVQELEALKKANADFFLLDVINQDEYDTCNLKGHLIPLTELPNNLNQLKKDQHIIVHCQAGGRSRRACEYLIQQGFTHVQNLKGGLSAWINEIDPTLTQR